MLDLLLSNEQGGKMARGIKNNTNESETKHENFKNTIINNKQLLHKMKPKWERYRRLRNEKNCFYDKLYDGKTMI